MKSYIKRTQRDYSLSFKLSVVKQIESGELTYTQAAKLYGIQSHSTVKHCLEKHSELDWHILGTNNREDDLMEQTPQTPEQRIKALEVQLKAAQQKAQLFETIVEVIRAEHPALLKKHSGKLCKPSKSSKP